MKVPEEQPAGTFLMREATEQERTDVERRRASWLAELNERYGHVSETCDFCKAMDEGTAYSEHVTRCVDGPDCLQCRADRGALEPVSSGDGDECVLFAVAGAIVAVKEDGAQYPVGYGPLMGVALGRSVYLYPTTHHPRWAKYRDTHLIYHDRAAAEAFMLEAARS